MNRRKLAADHLWIARYHAKRLSGTLDYWELLSIGHLALVQAAKRWPGEKAFVPFATTRIIQRMKNAIRDSQTAILKSQETNRLNQFERNGTKSPDERGKLRFDPPDDNDEPSDSVYYVRQWIGELPPDERQAVTLAYGIGTRKRTTGEIAKRLKLPQHQASEVIRSGLLRLRYMATCEMVNGQS